MLYQKERIAKRIKDERKALGLTQEQFAKKLMYSKPTISAWERPNGNNRIPDMEQLASICNLCKCEIGYLLCEYDEKTRIAADIHKETGLSEAGIELLREWHNENSDVKEITGIESTPTELVDIFIKECKSIADRVDSVKTYNAMIPILDIEYGKDNLYSACVSIHERISDPLDRWYAFLDWFRKEYPSVEHTDNYIYSNVYMVLCNSHMGDIDTVRFNIHQQIDRITNMLLSGEPASEDK